MQKQIHDIVLSLMIAFPFPDIRHYNVICLYR